MIGILTMALDVRVAPMVGLALIALPTAESWLTIALAIILENKKQT